MQLPFYSYKNQDFLMSKTAFSSRYSFPVAAVLRVLTHFTNGLLATKYFLFSIRFLLTIIICRPEKSIKKREEQNTLPDTLARIAREYLNTIQARMPFPDTANNVHSHTLSRGHQARPANISPESPLASSHNLQCVFLNIFQRVSAYLHALA